MKALNNLNEQLAIDFTINDDGRVILNYNQIESPKTHDVVQECRGLVLDIKNDWNLVARSFPRFFNIGENEVAQRDFDWAYCYATDKHDGSLLIVYYWNGEWHLNTRGSFAQGNINDLPLTWRELAEMALPKNWRDTFYPHYTYIIELCSRYNKVVRDYPTPKAFLLTTFDGENENAWEHTTDLGKMADISVPAKYEFYSPGEVLEFVRTQSVNDRTYEGVVLRDVNNSRIKVKSDEYVLLHRLANNGHICSVKAMVPIILKGEQEEVMSYFPEIRQFTEELSARIDVVMKQLDNVWFCFHDEPSQKRFALAIEKEPCRGALFQARKLGIHPHEVVRANPDMLINLLDK